MIRPLSPEEYPGLLREIPQPPKHLRCRGVLPLPENKLLAVVGARKCSQYGREVCDTIIWGLQGTPITIVSGLALGIDSIAHRAALKAGLQTIAIPGSGLDPKVLYPRSHVHLAEEIIEKGGGLLSEYDDLQSAAPWTFPQRNRIMAGISHATLIIEAEEKSGTLITARLAADYNREVGCVPGSLQSPTSAGPHLFLRLGAALIRSSDDILELLGLPRKDEGALFKKVENLAPEENLFLELLDVPCSRDELIRLSQLEIGLASSILSLLEIKGLITEEQGEVRRSF